MSQEQMEFDFSSKNPNDLDKEIKNLKGMEKKIYDCLPVGKEHAIKAKKIAQILNTDIDTVSATIHKLRLKSLSIGSLKVKPYGYYKFSNTDEFRDTRRMLRHGMNEGQKVLDALDHSFFGRKLKGLDDEKDGAKE